ncbi:MAG: tetratricopeptide repeat protein [Thermodesulfobacteriota bacterium]
MAKKKMSRKELLKGTDEFLSLSARAVNLLSTHVRELKLIGLGLAVVVVAYLSVYTYLQHVDKKGQEAYNLAYDILAQEKGPEGLPENLQQLEQRFQTVIDEYGRSEAARLALPQVGHIKFMEGDYDQAIAYYQRFADKISGTMEYQGLNSLALAACYEAKGEFQKAIDILTPVINSRDNPFQETAMLSLERVYRLAGQDQKATALLKEFVEKYENSPFYPMAKARLNKAT